MSPRPDPGNFHFIYLMSGSAEHMMDEPHEAWDWPIHYEYEYSAPSYISHYILTTDVGGQSSLIYLISMFNSHFHYCQTQLWFHNLPNLPRWCLVFSLTISPVILFTLQHHNLPSYSLNTSASQSTQLFYLIFSFTIFPVIFFTQPSYSLYSSVSQSAQLFSLHFSLTICQVISFTLS